MLSQFLKYFKNSKKSNSLKISFNEYLDKYLNDVINHKRCSEKGRYYSQGSIFTLNRTVSLLKQFQSNRNKIISWKDINMDFYYEFSAHLRDLGLKPNTIGKYIGTLKTLLSNAESEGVNPYSMYKNKKFKAVKEETHGIFLSHEEVAAIASVDLSGLGKVYSQTRDIFMIGILTAQRFSDYKRVSKEELSYVMGNYPVLNIVQQKTGKKVCVPCTGQLMALLQKYDFKLPEIKLQHFNKYIKVVAEKAGLGVKSKEVCSHTARRTAATLMYLDGMDLMDIMKITGHSSSGMLKLYIKADEMEVAEKLIRRYEFFRK